MGRHAARRAERSGQGRSGRTRAVLALGFLVLVWAGGRGTFAFWTDEAAVSGGTFTTGTLDLKVGDPAVDDQPADFTASFAMTSMVPGSHKDAVLRISNVGSVGFTYVVTASATNTGPGRLGSALLLSVGTACADPVAAADALAAPARALAAQTSENLCVRAALPADAPTVLQGQSTVVTLTVTATQLP